MSLHWGRPLLCLHRQPLGVPWQKLMHQVALLQRHPPVSKSATSQMGIFNGSPQLASREAVWKMTASETTRLLLAEI